MLNSFLIHFGLMKFVHGQNMKYEYEIILESLLSWSINALTVRL